VNVQEITFGVEIEATIPVGALTVAVGPHGCGTDIPELPGWKADRDPSIYVRTPGHEACEFVSPVFQGTAGLRQLLADLAKIKALGARVNESCGLHIHVGFDKSNVDASAKLATLVSNFEKAIYAATGTKKRERGRWCGGVNRHGNAMQAILASQRNRYHVCNFGTVKPTVEFRAFGATLNAAKLVGYVRLCVGLVERALKAKRLTDWTAKVPVETSPIHRDGEGQTAVTRLFYQLGWTKGRQSHTHGDLSGDGLPSMVRVKREFVRLAKKYDAQA
jgi:Putative amidoligase enzyme